MQRIHADLDLPIPTMQPITCRTDPLPRLLLELANRYRRSM